MIYLIVALLAIQIAHFVGYNIHLFRVRKKEKSTDTFLSNLHQWVVSNDTAILQHLEKMSDLTHTLYIRTRMIESGLRNKATGEKLNSMNELQELEKTLVREQWVTPAVKEASHREAIEKVRNEDIHLHYIQLLEEMQQLNREIARQAPRTDPSHTPVNGNGSRLKTATP